uniref:Uncharacterized protein n=1 Tax=Arundo donax TaxID=35708 RepID=A0A0A9H335_ARUDO
MRSKRDGGRFIADLGGPPRSKQLGGDPRRWHLECGDKCSG